VKCDGTRAENRVRLSAKRTSLFKSAGSSVQSTTGSRVVRISGSNAGYTMFRGSVKGTGYPLHSPASPSRPLPCVIVCHHVSTRLYLKSGSGRFLPNVLLFVIRTFTNLWRGHAVAQLVKALRYKSEGRGFDSRWFRGIFS
jgi:hypothetical protein